MNPDPMNLWSDDYLDGDSKGTNHLVHENVEFVRLQFRRPGTGEWISAWNSTADKNTDSADLQCSTARGEGCSFEWDLENQYFLNGLKDGPWEIRSKVFCSGYDSFATSDVRGSVTDENLNMIADVTKPISIEHKVYDNNLVVDFTESITCPQLSSSDMAYTVSRNKDCDGNAVSDSEADINKVSDAYLILHYTFQCLTHDVNGRNAWAMTVPISSAASSYALAGEYSITINDGFITDDGGNGAKELSFTEYIGCDSTATSTSSMSSSSESSASAKLGSTTDVSKPSSQQSIAQIFLAGIAFAFIANQLFVITRRRTLESKNANIKTNDESDDDAELLVPLKAMNNYGSLLSNNCESVL